MENERDVRRRVSLVAVGEQAEMSVTRHWSVRIEDSGGRVKQV